MPSEQIQALLQQLVEAGVHYGHRTSRWNPKMRPYIYDKKDLIHIINPQETLRGLIRAQKYLKHVASNGSLILFVGTKRQAGDAVEQYADACGMPYVSERWLGGTLTNFRTIRSRLSRFEELEELINSDAIHEYSKKMQAYYRREYRKMYRNLNGMRDMNRLPEAMVVIDPRKEHNAVREAKKLGVSTVALIDTDSDPDTVDLPIPGNDDSLRAVDLILKMLSDSIAQGKTQREFQQKDDSNEKLVEAASSEESS
ncbi:SSU ribosomal protein S2p (SAe) [Planctomycetales bacterium 10988]|nr:SSU ribosomal protein S2p (SAe) [Planctomycetales bacterium 10988]